MQPVHTKPRMRTIAIATGAAIVAASLAGSAAAVAVSAAGQWQRQPGDNTQAVRTAIEDAKAKNVILLIGDGMGDSEITIARNYAYGAAGELPGIDALPLTGSYTTYSVYKDGADKGKPDYVPDSAATGTAWATGSKTYDNAISVDVDGRCCRRFSRSRRRTGIAPAMSRPRRFRMPPRPSRSPTSPRVPATALTARRAAPMHWSRVVSARSGSSCSARARISCSAAAWRASADCESGSVERPDAARAGPVARLPGRDGCGRAGRRDEGLPVAARARSVHARQLPDPLPRDDGDRRRRGHSGHVHGQPGAAGVGPVSRLAHQTRRSDCSTTPRATGRASSCRSRARASTSATMRRMPVGRSARPSTSMRRCRRRSHSRRRTATPWCS